MIDPNTLTNRLIDGASPFRYTCTYASSSTFTIAGDWPSVITKGTALKLDQLSTTYYGYVSNVTYSSPSTTVTVVGFTLTNNAITNVYFGSLGVLADHGISISFTQSISFKASSTLPTYSTAISKFSCNNKHASANIAYNNLSGGTAGLGTAPFFFSLPIAINTNNIVNNRSVIGHGRYVNGSSIGLLVCITDGTEFFCVKSDGSNLVANDQNNASRSIAFSLYYPI